MHDTQAMSSQRKPAPRKQVNAVELRISGQQPVLLGVLYTPRTEDRWWDRTARRCLAVSRVLSLDHSSTSMHRLLSPGSGECHSSEAHTTQTDQVSTWLADTQADMMQHAKASGCVSLALVRWSPWYTATASGTVTATLTAAATPRLDIVYAQQAHTTSALVASEPALPPVWA